MEGMKKLLAAMFVALMMGGCVKPGRIINTAEGNISGSIFNHMGIAIMIGAVDWSKLQDRGGVTYLPNTQEPFSGYAKRVYENDQVALLAQFKDGYVVRLKQWLENGTPRWRVGYMEGKVGMEGMPYYGTASALPITSARSRFTTGTVRVFTVLKKLEEYGHGPVTTWHENGQKSSEENYKDGKRDGLAKGWHENGQKSGEVTYKDGKEDGLWTSWYENGQKRYEINYKDGKLMSAEIWKPNGEKCPVTNVKDGNGVTVWYYEQVTGISRHTYKDGELVEISRHIYKDGELVEISREPYKDGKEDGLKTGWYENGQKNYEVNYKDGKYDGLATWYYENGQKREERHYKDGKDDGLWTRYYENGQKREEGTYTDDKIEGLLTMWYENGQKQSEGTYTDDKREGLWTSWYENGQKRHERNYKDGKLMSAVVWKPNGEKCPETNVKDGNGVVVRYNDEGKVVVRQTYKDGERVFD